MGKRVVGASRLRRKLKRLPDEINSELRTVIAEEGAAVLHEMETRAPVSEAGLPKDFQGKPREHLRDALEMRLSKDGLKVRVGLIGKKVMKVFFFARFLEFGTRKMGKRPFIFPAWQSRRSSARKAVKDATIKALDTVCRSRPSDV